MADDGGGGKDKVEVIGSHSYSVVDVDDLIAKRDQNSVQFPPPGTTVAQKKDPVGNKTKWKSNDDLSSSSTSCNVGGREGEEEGRSSLRGSIDHLYDCVDNVMKSPSAGRRGDEKKPVPIKNTIQGRTNSLRVSPSTPPPPRGRGRSHVYEAMDDSFHTQQGTKGKTRSSSFDFVEPTDRSSFSSNPVTTLAAQSPGVKCTTPTSPSSSDPNTLYAQVDRSNRKKGGGEGLPPTTRDVAVTGGEEGPPVLPMRSEDDTITFPSSPSPPPPVPEPLVTFSISGEEGRSNTGDQPDGGNERERGEAREDDQDASAGGPSSPPPRAIQHTLSSQGAVYAVIAKEKGSGPPLPPPLQAPPEIPLLPSVPPATLPPRPPPPTMVHNASGSSVDSTYAVCGGGGGAAPLLPPRSPLPPGHAHAQPSTKPLPAIPTSTSTVSLGTMEPTYAVPDIENRTTAVSTGDRPQATPTPKVPPVTMPTRPLPPLVSSPSGGRGPSSSPQGIMDPEYATPGMSYVVSVPTASDTVMGHFHIKEGVAGPQAGVVGTSPPPPSTTIQANMELDTKTTTEQQGVATTPPAPLAEAKDAREALTATTGRKKHKKHSYEDVKTLDEVPPTVPLGSGTSPPLGVLPPPKQSFALPRQLGEPGRPVKSRAKSLKPKNKPAPEPPSVPEGAGGRTRVGVSLDDSSIRSEGNREEIKVRNVWCV